MAHRIEGIVVPVLTPFKFDTDELDVDALRRLVDRLVDAGVSALIANAGTSEFYHLDESERLKEAEVVVEQAAGRLPVLVGAGAVATRHSIRWAKHAESIGASGLLIMAPYYVPLSKPAILRHYMAISDAVSTPIMLYNNPSVTQVLLNPDDLAEFVQKANIPWIKLTTMKLDDVPMLVDRLGDKISILEGGDTIAFASMMYGAVGWVAGPGNAIPDLAVELWRLTRVERDLAKAQLLHRRLAPLLDFLSYEGVYCSALKKICELRGYPIGAVRAPFDELNTTQEARLLELAAGLGFRERLAA